MTNLRKHIILGLFGMTLLFASLFPETAMAQYDNSLYNLKVVPQTNLYNPAFIPDYKFHFGFPMLSSEEVGFGTTGPKYDDVFYTRADDSLVMDFEGFINSLDDKNALYMHNITQILNVGFRINKFYINGSISEIVDVNFRYSKEFMDLVVHGNADKVGETIEINGMGIKAQHYREYALGLAYEVNKNLSIGTHVKLLYGKAAIDTKRMDGSITTLKDNYNLDIKSNILVNTSLPDMEDQRITTTDYLMYSGNVGMAFDFGASYKLDKMSFAASVLDLGWINYDRWLKNYSSDNAEFTYKGIDLVELQGLSSSEREDKMKDLRDSIINTFELKETHDAFNVALSSKIYLSANYQLSKSSNVGVMTRIAIFDNIVNPSFTVSFNQDLGKNLSVIGSYTIANKSYANIGFGIAARISKLQFYLVSDNILGAFMPEIVKYTNIHLGVNFVFPEKAEKKAMMNLDVE